LPWWRGGLLLNGERGKGVIFPGSLPRRKNYKGHVCAARHYRSCRSGGEIERNQLPARGVMGKKLNNFAGAEKGPLHERDRTLPQMYARRAEEASVEHNLPGLLKGGTKPGMRRHVAAELIRYRRRLRNMVVLVGKWRRRKKKGEVALLS